MHLCWSIERDGKCPRCGAETVLCAMHGVWIADSESECAETEYDTDEELTAHVCPQCRRIRSLALNA